MFAYASRAAGNASGEKLGHSPKNSPHAHPRYLAGAWAQALSAGDLDAAAALFALPSVAENGPTLRIATREQARLFNASLPCGAEVIGAEGEGEFTTATFKLTERPGPGRCGAGTGGEAQTTFVVEDGKIAEWRRVGGLGASGEVV